MMGRHVARLATARGLVVAGICLLTGQVGITRVNAESILFAFTGATSKDAVELRGVDVSAAPGDSGMALRVDGEDDAAWAEAEAALLEGWVILGLDYGIALRGWETRASDPYEEAIPIVLGIGPTPAAALRALAAKLHGMPR